MLMLKDIQGVIDEYKMLSQGSRVLACVSGGADSMCLLKVLMMIREAYNLELFVIHVNHQLRAEDSKADERYVQKFCEEACLPFILEYADVSGEAEAKGLSLEEAGRNLRYQLFDKACTKYKCDKIAVAHHLEDVAETVLFYMFRGTGLRGMRGIPPVRGNIIRPLIRTGRDEIEEFLIENKITWRTDKSNLSDIYTRNKIRHNILSYAKSSINTGASLHISELSVQLSETYDFISLEADRVYEEAVVEINGGFIIDSEAIMNYHSIIRKELLMKVLEKCYGGRKNITSCHIQEILKLIGLQSGKQAVLPGGLTAVREYNKIIITDKPADKKYIPDKDIELTIPGQYILPWLGRYLKLDIKNYNKSDIIPKNNCTKWFDYDKIDNIVKLRAHNESDYIKIHKLGGHKKIKALLIDEKIPKSLRDKILVLADGSSILWVPGIRASEGYYADEETKRILTAEIY